MRKGKNPKKKQVEHDDAADEPRTQTDLAALVRTLCDDLADTGARVTCEGPERLAYVCAPAAMKRALQNVIVNAVKYGSEASVTVAATDDGIEVTVADRGPGIPADRREDVFRPFYRLETSRNRETGGSGLGLAVARSIVRRHGGDIVLEDRDGGGLVVRPEVQSRGRRLLVLSGAAVDEATGDRMAFAVGTFNVFPAGRLRLSPDE